MVDARKQLRLLNLSAIDPAKVAGKSHGALDPLDLAAALAGLDRGAYLLGMYVWAQHYDLQNQVLDEIERELIMLCVAKGWRIRIEMIEGLARLLLEEATGFPHCRRCSGKGEVYLKGGKIRACKVCGGEGLRVMTERERARIAGISSSYWQRSMSRKYVLMRSIVAGMEARLCDHVSRKLR